MLIEIRPTILLPCHERPEASVKHEFWKCWAGHIMTTHSDETFSNGSRRDSQKAEIVFIRFWIDFITFCESIRNILEDSRWRIAVASIKYYIATSAMFITVKVIFDHLLGILIICLDIIRWIISDHKFRRCASSKRDKKKRSFRSLVVKSLGLFSSSSDSFYCLFFFQCDYIRVQKRLDSRPPKLPANLNLKFIIRKVRSFFFYLSLSNLHCLETKYEKYSDSGQNIFLRNQHVVLSNTWWKQTLGSNE